MFKPLPFLLFFAAYLLFNLPAHAQAPLAHNQVPGYYRIQLGQFEITGLYDGAIQLDAKLLHHAKPANLNRLLARMFVGNPKMQTAVNAYLINTGEHLVLVDAGASKLFGPTLGFTFQNLRASGFAPDQVDTIIITHLHADHMGGLNDENGKPLYPNATVWVSQTDNDFWLSEKVAEGMPEERQPYFERARDAAAPYLAAGRWKTFQDGAALVPGVRAVKANGHTPGHTAYAVESAGQKLLIWGDVVHAPCRPVCPSGSVDRI